ncbi:Bystin-domain-containing protein [Atractiella rhizophila]|nr:Bystin-domain-containing protein [Atractiella rhizophila]
MGRTTKEIKGKDKEIRLRNQDVAVAEKVFRLAREQKAEEEEGHDFAVGSADPLLTGLSQLPETDSESERGDHGSDFEMSDAEHPLGPTLADLIMEKLQEQESKKQGRGEPSSAPEINPHVMEVYTKVGIFLSRYKSGPIPKAFKILPTLQSWRKLLDLTSPENWTPHATLAASRIFISNLDPRESQKFLSDILLPKIRDEISENRKLSVQSYQAIKQAVYKPSAFFKGLLLPLCASPSCTLREASIVGSVVAKVSIPAIHSGAGILKLCGMDYSGPQSIFLRVLLDKKYALPYQVIDALVLHFAHSATAESTLPVLWHQAFLVFVQRYKQDLTAEQRERILDVLRQQNHPIISQEIRREVRECDRWREQGMEP